MKILISNKIEKKVFEYQKKTGASKKWIADRVGISTSRMYKIFRSEMMMIDIYIRFAYVLNCEVQDLFDYQIVED